MTYDEQIHVLLLRTRHCLAEACSALVGVPLLIAAK